MNQMISEMFGPAHAALLSSLFGAQSYDPSLWSSVGIVPTYLPQAPSAPIRVYWPDSRLAPRMNETVATEDILEEPRFKWRGDKGSLYTVMIVDFGVDQGGANFIHFMEHNVRRSRFNFQAVEVCRYPQTRWE